GRAGRSSQISQLGRAVGSGRRAADAADESDVERAVQMRKQVAAAGRLPPEGLAQVAGLDLEHDKPRSTCEVASRGLARLGRGGEVDVAVREIYGRALETPGGLGGGPLRLSQNLVDAGQSQPSLRMIRASQRGPPSPSKANTAAAEVGNPRR